MARAADRTSASAVDSINEWYDSGTEPFKQFKALLIVITASCASAGGGGILKGPSLGRDCVQMVRKLRTELLRKVETKEIYTFDIGVRKQACTAALVMLL